ncbi:MAG: DUF2905 domain-containing protein [Chloroflexota bacterium]
MISLAKTLVLIGIVLILVGGAVYLLSRFNLPLGRLPGDIRIERDGFTFYFPLTSAILISLVLTILLNVIVRFLKK